MGELMAANSVAARAAVEKREAVALVELRVKVTMAEVDLEEVVVETVMKAVVMEGAVTGDTLALEMVGEEAQTVGGMVGEAMEQVGSRGAHR